jgi:hypothetical protein
MDPVLTASVLMALRRRRRGPLVGRTPGHCMSWTRNFAYSVAFGTVQPPSTACPLHNRYGEGRSGPVIASGVGINLVLRCFAWGFVGLTEWKFAIILAVGKEVS